MFRPLFALLLLALAVGCGPRQTLQMPQERPAVDQIDPKATFSETILSAIADIEERLGCRIGFSFRDKDLELAVSHNGDVLFHPASTMKVPVMIEVYRQAEQGLFSMDDTLVVHNEFPSLIDGSPFTTGANRYLRDRMGQPVSIYELTREMIQTSDNVATNMLIELCGAPKITATMRSLGARRSYIIRPLMDNEAYEAGISNRMTPEELTILMERIDRDEAASPQSCEAMREILLGQRHRNLIPGNLPEGTPVASKSGSITGHRHDTGIVYAPFATWYLTILIDGVRDTGAAVNAAADLSRLIYDERERLAQGAR